MNAGRPLRIAVVAGEESGDLLGHDLIEALRRMAGRDVELVGIGGRHLASLGLKPLFDSSEISLMGIGAILRDLPRLVRRIGQAARAIVAARPDCLVTIDTPEFSLRVAKRVRAADPGIPIVHYVCPSVWAWRPSRAAAMRPYVDHVLCLLPFEPDELKRLGGPPGTFVGHRLATDRGILQAARMQAERGISPPGQPRNILVLPGSRRGEVSGLIGSFGETMAKLRARGHRLKLALPTVPHVAPLVREATASWAEKPEIVLDPERKWQVFGEADAAIIASGTVSLELALARVPFVSCYKLDPVGQLFKSLVTVWSAILPNIIADRVIVPEFYHEYIRPEHLARDLEALFEDTAMRAWQKDGFAEVARRMHTERPAGELAGEIVLKAAGNRQ
ncbi:lipid-A-disaccharide synthase [Pseudaminobacter sp. 19-2017]|uniref:Lipid-A-disaccharide synthase n=1 Tax=Pseudaminobacter soli (ex Zhang et al. 2022) TaxID=2831468 RepID=A0A942E6D4_9HYPH|nr:lipid-A-disaccharide synthase [Pseudaminobacter soli]MBS3651345.1 lipid-A-disaccharide synthase [Pseudaminobacter soli]